MLMKCRMNGVTWQIGGRVDAELVGGDDLDICGGRLELALPDGRDMPKKRKAVGFE